MRSGDFNYVHGFVVFKSASNPCNIFIFFNPDFQLDVLDVTTIL